MTPVSEMVEAVLATARVGGREAALVAFLDLHEHHGLSLLDLDLAIPSLKKRAGYADRQDWNEADRALYDLRDGLGQLMAVVTLCRQNAVFASVYLEAAEREQSGPSGLQWAITPANLRSIYRKAGIKP